MANEIRLRPNFVAGGLSADMASGVTTMQSGGLADLGTVDATNHVAITLWRTDLAGRVTQKEIVWMTLHTASATSGTIVRAREGTTAQNWLTGDRWSISQLSSDVITICTAATRPANPYTGMAIYETDTKREHIYNGAQWDPIGGLKLYNKATGLAANSSSSASFVDVPTAIDLPFTKVATHTLLAMWGTMTHYVTGSGGLVAHAVLINGTDYSAGDFYFNALSQHMLVGMGVLLPAGIPAGNYNARLRWRNVSGGVTMNTDTNDVANYWIQEVLP